MPLPQRVAEEDPRRRQFDFGSVYELETASISDWLRDEANRALGSGVPAETAASQGPQLSSEIGLTFARDLVEYNPSLFSSAANGELQGKVPSAGSAMLYLGVAGLLFIVELGVNGWQYVHEGSLAIVILAFVLAGGGLVAGHGFAKILEYLKPLPSHYKHEKPGLGVPATEVLGGCAAIAGAAYFRTTGEDTGAGLVIFITVGIALLMAWCEAIGLYARSLRETLASRMYLASQWYATRQHQANCSDGSYSKMYVRFLGTLKKMDLEALTKAGGH